MDFDTRLLSKYKVTSYANPDSSNPPFILAGVLNGVGVVEGHAQPRRKLLALGTSQREVPQRLAGGLDRRDDPRCNVGGGFGRDAEPDFNEVGFGGVG